MSPHIGHTRDLLYYRPEKGGEERYISEFVEQSMPDSGRPQLVFLRAVVVTKVDRNVDKIVLLLHFPPDSSLLSSNTLLYSGRITHLAPIFQRRVQNLTRDDIIYCDSWDDIASQSYRYYPITKTVALPFARTPDGASLAEVDALLRRASAASMALTGQNSGFLPPRSTRNRRYCSRASEGQGREI